MRERKEFNFVQRWEAEKAKELGRFSKNSIILIAGAASSALLILTLAAFPWIYGYKLKHDQDFVNQEINSMKDIRDLVQNLNNLKNKANQQKQYLDLVQKENHDPITVLSQLGTLLPEGVKITSFTYSGDAVTVGLSVPTTIDVARLWVSIRDSGVFQGVDFKTVSLEDKAQNMTLNLKYDSKATLKTPTPSGDIPQTGDASQTAKIQTSSLFGIPPVQNGQDKSALPCPSKISFATDQNALTRINWENISGADHYNVYYSGTSDGNYKKIAEVTVPIFYDQEARGSSYFYRFSTVDGKGNEGVLSQTVKVQP